MSFDLFSTDPIPPDGSDHRELVEAAGRRRVARRRGIVASVAAALVVVVVLPVVLRSDAPETRVQTDQTSGETSAPTTTGDTAPTTTGDTAPTTDDSAPSVVTTLRKGAAATTTTRPLDCHDSFDARCGDFHWTSEPRNQPMRITVTADPPAPRVGETVTFTITEDDPDSSFNGYTFSAEYGNGNGYHASLNAPRTPPFCQVAYGPWGVPTGTPGHKNFTLKNTYSEPGSYTATFTDKSQTHLNGPVYNQAGPGDPNGQCREPYASTGSATLTVQVTN